MRADVAVAPFDPRRLGEVAAMLSRAFAEDPLYVWMWPDAGRRRRHLTPFVEGEVRVSARCGRIDMALDPEGRLLGAALWGRPGEYPFSYVRSALAMARVMPRLGAGGLARLPRLAAVDRHHPSQPHWYLLTLGVEPSAQGRGVGTRLIENQAAESDPAGVPIYLETFNPANPTYYRRLGFTDLETVDRGPLPRFWTMLRPPRAAPQE
jgi:ribosomal protein S18 acetylase RimI-like enzyme